MITTFNYENENDIKVYSHLILSEGLRPRRMVLREVTFGRMWVVQMETMGLEGDTWKHESYYGSRYFEAGGAGYDAIEAMNDAMANFDGRLKIL